MYFAPVANVVLSSVKPEEEGQASGANNAIRELGGVFGVAVLARGVLPLRRLPDTRKLRPRRHPGALPRRRDRRIGAGSGPVHPAAGEGRSGAGRTHASAAHPDSGACGLRRRPQPSTWSPTRFQTSPSASARREYAGELRNSLSSVFARPRFSLSVQRGVTLEAWSMGGARIPRAHIATRTGCDFAGFSAGHERHVEIGADGRSRNASAQRQRRPYDGADVGWTV